MYAKTNYLNTDNKKCLDKLIVSGANLHTKDVFGKTLLDWVKEENTVLYNYLREIK